MTQWCEGYEKNETKRQLLALPNAQYAAELAMEHSRLDSFGPASVAEDQPMVVHRRLGIVAAADPAGHVADRLGCSLRRRKRPAQRK